MHEDIASDLHVVCFFARSIVDLCCGKDQCRDLIVLVRTDAAASEGIEGAVARAQLCPGAGADAIFPEALTDVEMSGEVARRLPGVKLLANMTEFGRTPALIAHEFQKLDYSMVIWPVSSSLRVAAKAQKALFAEIRE